MRAVSQTVLAVAALSIGMGMSLPTKAVTQSIYAYTSPGGSCQLSIPTTDTKVRPKATGYRNEGTMGAFAICGYSRLGTAATVFKQLEIGLVAYDGADHDVSCTAVTGLSGHSTVVYSTKVIPVPANGTLAFQPWYPSDFGSAGPTIPNAFEPSVTCTLPGGVAIVHLAGNLDFDVGN